jgi:hypothetical protein
MLKDAEERGRQIFDPESITLSDANHVYEKFFGKSMPGENKPEKIKNAIDNFLFTVPGAFDEWLAMRGPRRRGESCTQARLNGWSPSGRSKKR